MKAYCWFKYKISICFVGIIFFVNTFFAQDELIQDQIFHAECGLNHDFIESLSSINEEDNSRTVNTFPSNAVFQCGAFALYFQDIRDNLNGGFDDPILGATRINTFCAVLQYVQNTFDFSNIPINAPIRIRVGLSFAPTVNPAPIGTTFYAIAGPVYNLSGFPEINNGLIHRYVTSGIDEAVSTGFHGILQVNFDKAYNGNSEINFSYLENHNNQITNCEVDLFSVLLHEIGHTLGFLSRLNENGIVDGNQLTFSGLDFLLHRGEMSVPANFEKLVLGTIQNPVVNPLLVNTNINGANYWSNNNPAPINHPIYSGSTLNNSSMSYAVGSALSHMDEQVLSYTYRSRISPGIPSDYVMGPFGIKGHLRRRFTDHELEIFQQIGYGLNVNYDLTNLMNTPPYSIKMANYTNYDDRYFTDIIQSDFPVLENNIGSSLTIDLWQDSEIMDLDNDQITVALNTLTNIRGCGNGDNNNYQIQVSLDGRFITFTPRPNFIGRAQFAFKLFDGNEVGSWHMYTIDVIHGNNVNFPAGSNLVINGNFEEGTEVRRIGQDQNKHYTSGEFNGLFEGFLAGTHFSDAHPFTQGTNGWWPSGAGNIIKNSSIRCNTPINGMLFGQTSNSIILPTPGISSPNPPAAVNGGERYTTLNGPFKYFTLGNPVEKCKKYKVSFDYYKKLNTNGSTASSHDITFGFINDLVVPGPGIQIDYIFSYTETLEILSTNQWNHFETNINYCGNEPSDFLVVSSDYIIYPEGLLIDNLVLEELLEPLEPLVVNLQDSYSICSGSEVVLLPQIENAFCDVTYNWQPNNETSASILVSPSQTSTFSVEVSDGCRTEQKEVLIEIVDSPILPEPQVVCQGSPVNLQSFSNGSSNVTFSWTNDNTAIGLVASGTGNIPTFIAQNNTSGPITAIISVTPNSGSCVGLVQSFTITVNPNPILIISPQNPTIAIGQSVQLNATGGTNYTWSPSNGLSCTNCSDPIASPSTTTLYTVSSSNGLCSSSAGTTVTVNGPICSNCPILLGENGTISSSPQPGRSYCVNNDVTITSNVTIQMSELRIGSNVSIYVNPNATLTIKGSHLYACEEMWKGIIVRPGGRIVVENGFGIAGYFLGVPIFSLTPVSTLIEDAKIAIDILDNSPLVSNILKVDNVTFNKNLKGIRISNYTQQISPYPFTVSNCIFTCRNIPFGVFVPNQNAWPQTTAVRGNGNGSPNSYSNLYINNNTFSQTNQNAYLKVPFFGQKSAIGIELNTVGKSNNVSINTVPTYFEFSIGNATSMNIFDNQQIGVDLFDANFTSFNSIYQNTGIKGIGIRSRSTDKMNARLQVLSVATSLGMNKFVDCGTAILSRNYFEHNIRYTDIRSSQVTSDMSTYKNGINIQTNRNRLSNINNNAIYNVDNGIVFTENNGGFDIPGVLQGFGQFGGNINVNNNIIRPQTSGGLSTIRHVTNAIVLQNSGNITHQYNNVTPILSSTNNTITANRGIYYLNWLKQNSQIQNNTITVRENPNLFVGAIYFGIAVNNCAAGSANGNFIRSNNITGFYIPTSNSSPNNDPNLRGIVQALSPVFSVTCNTTKNTTRGIEFAGTNMGTTFRNNTMSQHRYGFVLDQNGVIGTQGNPTSPADNQWTGTWLAGTFKTATLGGSSAQNSKMYVRNSANYNPNGSGFTSLDPIVDIYSTTSNPQTLLLQNNPFPPLLACFQIISFPTLIKSMELITKDSILVSDMVESARYISKNMVFRSIKDDVSLKDSSQVLEEFFDESLFSSREKLFSIEKKLSGEDFLQGIIENLTLVPENFIEQNYKEYFRLHILKSQNELDQVEKENLKILAEKCPFEHGQVIYQARALYNEVNDSIKVYEEPCETQISNKSIVLEYNNSTTNQFEAILFPNPSNGEVNVLLNQINLETINVKVLDVNGKLVSDNQDIINQNGLSKLNFNVKNGVYFIYIENPKTHEIIIKKIVIHN